MENKNLNRNYFDSGFFIGEHNVNYPNTLTTVGKGFGFVISLLALG